MKNGQRVPFREGLELANDADWSSSSSLGSYPKGQVVQFPYPLLISYHPL
jgi:hypothetical protein